MSETYREFDGYYPLTRFSLDRNATINSPWRSSKKATRTVHNNLHILHETIHEFQRLCCGRMSFLSRQPIQPLQHSFHIILAQQFLPEFPCIAMCY